MVKVGINGFGRIGRCALRIAVKNPEVEVVAVNARSGIDTYAHLLKYDTLHGTFDEDVRVDGDVIAASSLPASPNRRKFLGVNWVLMLSLKRRGSSRTVNRSSRIWITGPKRSLSRLRLKAKT